MRIRRAPAVMAVLLAASLSHAKDYCFNSTSPPNPAPADNPDVLVVAKNFSFPKRGNCKPIAGFEIAWLNQTFPRPASGTACLDSAGTTLHVGVLVHAVESPFNTEDAWHFHMKVPYPGLTGGAVYIRRNNPLLSKQRNDGVVGPCGFKFPIP